MWISFNATEAVLAWMVIHSRRPRQRLGQPGATTISTWQIFPRSSCRILIQRIANSIHRILIGDHDIKFFAVAVESNFVWSERKIHHGRSGAGGIPNGEVK